MSSKKMNTFEQAASLDFIYLYTPVCGTCAVAKSYLDIVREIPGTPPITEKDINLAPSLAVEWEIESVPCLVKLKNGIVIEKLYAFEHVAKTYNFIRGDENGSS